jgi:hypothetical protein
MTSLRSVQKSLFLSVALIFAAGAANAGSMVPVTEVPGAVQFSTSPLGLTDKGVLTGSYMGADGHSHGFVGPDGEYTSFDVGTNGTQPRAINNGGYIIGLSNADTNPVLDGFMFEGTPSLTFTPITMGGVQMLGIPQGINEDGLFVGGYHPASGTVSQVNGFYGLNSQYAQELTLPFPTIQIRARGINKKGVVVGLYFGSDGITHGFIVKNNAVTVVTYPDPTATGTNLEGINADGDMTGSWNDASGFSHSFILSKDLSTFTSIEPVGSADNQAWGINKSGEVVISSDIGPFIYCEGGDTGLCKVKKTKKAVKNTTVRANLKSFACVNNCRSSGPLPVRASAARVVERPLTARQLVYRHPQ